MTIAGKKIVTLDDKERAVLQSAIDLLNALSDAVGDDTYFNFEEVSDTLYYIRNSGPFEVNFEQ